MKKTALLITAAAVMSAGTAFASGYRIPEQSINSVALSAAYVANANGADTSYFNPANMSWVTEQGATEVDLTYVNLHSIEFTNSNPLLSGLNPNSGSKTEDFILPQLHGVSPAYAGGKVRVGVSLIHPGGLSKRWDNGYQRASAEEFTLKVTELNPSMSYKISDMVSAAVGVRAIYATGVVKSTAAGSYVPLALQAAGVTLLSRDLEGDTTEYGYNAALTVKPIQNLSIATTYRSKVDLDIEGDATLIGISPVPTVGGTYTGGANVSVPLPEVWALAVAYTIANTTVEFTYDRTKWSDYQTLDFNYSGTLTGVSINAFDTPVAKNWKDTDAFRLGITQKINDKLSIMGAIAIDENPVPDETLGFELPDSDAMLFSLGARYQATDRIDVGLSYLYDEKDSRTVNQSSATAPTGMYGTFDGAKAHLVTAGMQFKF